MDVSFSMFIDDYGRSELAVALGCGFDPESSPHVHDVQVALRRNLRLFGERLRDLQLFAAYWPLVPDMLDLCGFPKHSYQYLQRGVTYVINDAFARFRLDMFVKLSEQLHMFLVSKHGTSLQEAEHEPVDIVRYFLMGAYLQRLYADQANSELRSVILEHAPAIHLDCIEPLASKVICNCVDPIAEYLTEGQASAWQYILQFGR